DHLSPDEAASVAAAEARQNVLGRDPSGEDVGVEARHGNSGEERGEDLLDALRSRAALLERRPEAARARPRGRGRPVVAEVAERDVVSLVVSERDVALRTLEDELASPAVQERREASSVDEDDRALVSLERTLERELEGAREERLRVDLAPLLR